MSTTASMIELGLFIDHLHSTLPDPAKAYDMMNQVFNFYVKIPVVEGGIPVPKAYRVLEVEPYKSKDGQYGWCFV